MSVGFGFNLKKITRLALKRTFKEDVSLASLDEAITRVETQIGFTVAEMGFDHAEDARRFAYELCFCCVFYGLLPVVYPRRPHHLSDELRIVNKLHKIAARLSRKYPGEADALSQVANRVSKLQKVGRQRRAWSTRNAKGRLAVVLDEIFRFNSVCRRPGAIADLVATTFGLDDTEVGRVDREASREKWVQQLIRRHRHKVRDISYFSDSSQN